MNNILTDPLRVSQRLKTDIKIKAKIEDKRLKKPVKIDLESKSGEQI